MANIILNSDFERGLRQWEDVPEHWAEGLDPLVRTQEWPVRPPQVSKGQSLYIELGRWVAIEQSYPWVVFAEESHLHLSFGGAMASFYVNIHYEDGTADGSLFYGRWPLGWENELVPVSTEKGIVRLEFLVQSAHDFYLDDISLEGSSISHRLWGPMFRKIPEEVYDIRRLQAHIEGRMLGMERELKRITALLSMQQYPDIDKNVEAALAKRVPKGDSVSTK